MDAGLRASRDSGHTGGVGREEKDDIINQPDTSYLPVRRRPSLRNFLLLSGGIGLIAGLLIGWYGPDAPGASQLQEAILLGTVGLLFGGFLGAIAYLFADKMSLRK